jgi:hypothetical protein
MILVVTNHSCLRVGRHSVVLEISKKYKSSTALVIQEQITKIAESASSFASKKEGGVTIKEVMYLVLECGADYGTTSILLLPNCS